MRIYITVWMMLTWTGLTFAQASHSGTPEEKLFRLFTLQHKGVLVTAHRGDWRNAPENSIQGLNNCIAMGVDIAEFDLKKTKDGKLIIMHDNTIDRSTTGKGKPEEYTWDELRKVNLRSGTGHATKHTIPSFNKMLAAAKGRIIVDIDKGYEYYEDVIKELKEQGMMKQAILNIYGLPFDSLQAQHGHIPEELTLQLIINPDKPDAEKIIESYKAHARTIIQVIFKTDTSWIIDRLPELKKRYVIWFNSLWPEQNGGHDDDKAVEENKPDETWGWLISHHADIIQTDRPVELLRYLKTKKEHQF
ncbi:MAG TPA: glycerophosphodiester phosphodiesterase family protein [Chitinophaga sp.]|nr:glycerophosphodiester phosphodiesterase family protein [Chitinophaga sp.]